MDSINSSKWQNHGMPKNQCKNKKGDLYESNHKILEALFKKTGKCRQIYNITE